MKNAGTFQVTTPTDREILMTRTFDAPRAAVFEAWTKSIAPRVRNTRLQAPTAKSRLLNDSCSR